MFRGPDREVHLFLEFTHQAITGAFPKLQSATGELGEIHSPDMLIAYQYLLVLIDQNAVNTNVEHATMLKEDDLWSKKKIGCSAADPVYLKEMMISCF